MDVLDNFSTVVMETTNTSAELTLYKVRKNTNEFGW